MSWATADEASGFFVDYAGVRLAELTSDGPTTDPRDTYLADGHVEAPAIRAAIRAYWDETGWPVEDRQEIGEPVQAWAILDHLDGCAEDEGWSFSWEGVTWATPGAFRVTVAWA